jgi:hypothetical protein
LMGREAVSSVAMSWLFSFMSALEMTVFAVNEFGIDIVPEPLRGMASPGDMM